MNYHGNRGRYVAGCRCEECVKANSDYQREWRHRTGLHTAYEDLGDAYPYRVIILSLRNDPRYVDDVSYARIAGWAGVSAHTIIAIANGTTRRVRAETAAKLRRLVALLPSESEVA
jgi:hypothetical protein